MVLRPSEGLSVLELFSFDEAGLFDNNSWEFNALAIPGIEKIKINNVVRNLRMSKIFRLLEKKIDYRGKSKGFLHRVLGSCNEIKIR